MFLSFFLHNAIAGCFSNELAVTIAVFPFVVFHDNSHTHLMSLVDFRCLTLVCGRYCIKKKKFKQKKELETLALARLKLEGMVLVFSLGFYARFSKLYYLYYVNSGQDTLIANTMARTHVQWGRNDLS